MKTRRTYIPIRIDFTPFVSIALLLIVFFVWVKMVQRPNVTSLVLPNESQTFCGDYPIADASLYLLDNNRIGYLAYRRGTTQAEFVETNYSIDGIHKLLFFLSTTSKKTSSFIVVKPTEQATIKNVVDIIKEIKINSQIRFSFVTELNQTDRHLLQEYHRLREKGLLPALKKVTLDPSWYKGG